MAFSAKDVAKLRETTGVGMMDCKKALAASDGDFDKAVEFLREKGLAAAAKKASRIAADGMVYANTYDCGAAAMVEVNSETDFVAKNADFQAFVAGIAKAVLENDVADVDALMNVTFPESDLTVATALQEKILTIGENIKIRRFERYAGGANILNTSYVHMGGKIGVLVAMEVSEGLAENEEVKQLGKDIAMQIAAMRPQWLDRDAVPADIVAKEKEILMAQTLEEGKPEKVAEKIVMGRIGKFYQENCLVDQAFVKESKFSVNEQVAQVAKAAGGSIKLVNFARYEKGEGLEKREENFAEEIAKQLGK